MLPVSAAGDGAPRPRLGFRRRFRALIATACLIIAAAVAGWAFGSGNGAVPAEDSVDVGFLRDMADHHDQAVQLSLLLLDRGEDPVLRGFATDTIASQRYEIGLMDARLQDWGHGRGSVDRQVMAWMGMPVPLSEMPGMATRDQLAELAAATGLDADLLFIELMTAHHEGGIHMAEHAWQHAENARVRQLAERIAKVQLLETRDMALVRERLVASAPPSRISPGS